MRNLLIAIAALVLASGPAGATADGPDYWRVTGVAANDVLNMRGGPSRHALKIGEIPHDADGLTNLECVGEMSLVEYQEATEAEREAARHRRWCLVLYRDWVGWVAGRFLEEGDESDRPGTEFRFDYAGSEWSLVPADGSKPAADVTIRFAAGGKLSGGSGCNRFTGGYIRRGLDIMIGDLASTRKMCSGDVMSIESAALGVFSRARMIAGGQNVMALFDRDGGLMATFRRTDRD